MGIFSQVTPPTLRTIRNEIDLFHENGTKGQYITNMIQGNEGKGISEEDIIQKMILEFYKEASLRYFKLTENPEPPQTIPIQPVRTTPMGTQGSQPLGSLPTQSVGQVPPANRVPNSLAQPVPTPPTRESVAAPVRTLDDIINKRPISTNVPEPVGGQPITSAPPVRTEPSLPFGITNQPTDDYARPFAQLLSYSGESKPYLLGKEFYTYVKETFPNFSQIEDEAKVFLPHFKTPNDISTNSFISMDFRTLETILKDKLEYVTEDGSEFTHDGFIDQLPIDYNFVVNIFMGGNNPQEHNEFLITPVFV